MFVPGDPRFDELVQLASHATGSGLHDRERSRWRELCAELLGVLKAEGSPQAERRRQLRAPSRLEVHLLAPEELQGLVASSIGSGGVRLQFEAAPPPGAEALSAGTIVELSISVDRKKVPLLVHGQVVYALETGEVGVAFIDLIQSDRELLEGLAVRTLLGEP